MRRDEYEHEEEAQGLPLGLKIPLQDIYMAATRETALQAWDQFTEHYQLKYTKAVDCLLKDKDKRLTLGGGKTVAMLKWQKAYRSSD